MDQVLSHKGHLILVWINLQFACCLIFPIYCDFLLLEELLDLGPAPHAAIH